MATRLTNQGKQQRALLIISSLTSTYQQANKARTPTLFLTLIHGKIVWLSVPTYLLCSRSHAANTR